MGLEIYVLLCVLLSMTVQLTDCNCDYFTDYAATNNYTKNKDWFCDADSIGSEQQILSASHKG